MLVSCIIPCCVYACAVVSARSNCRTCGVVGLVFVVVVVALLCCRDVQGLIVCLDDTGRLECYYLGTDPSMPVISSSSSRDLDYGAMDAEMQSLQDTIRNSMLGGKHTHAHTHTRTHWPIPHTCLLSLQKCKAIECIPQRPVACIFLSLVILFLCEGLFNAASSIFLFVLGGIALHTS